MDELGGFHRHDRVKAKRVIADNTPAGTLGTVSHFQGDTPDYKPFSENRVWVEFNSGLACWVFLHEIESC